VSALTLLPITQGRDAASRVLDLKTLPVALVCMPWASVKTPSLALAILKQCVKQAGGAPDVYYLNLRFARQLGMPLYEVFSDESYLHPEWFFAQALFGANGSKEMANDWNGLRLDPTASQLTRTLLEIAAGIKHGDPEQICKDIADVQVPAFIDECLSSIHWSDYRLIGFTTTFAQSLASLLLAHRIKQKYPNVLIAVGGANVDSEMGVEFMRAFEWIDYVVHGEAEESFVQLLHTISTDSRESVPGVSMRHSGTVLRGDAGARPVIDLNSSPTPDYSDYVKELEASGLNNKSSLMLYFESSRGCWWGAKQHCTFCGLNGKTMAYRRKAAARVYSEIVELSTTYKCLRLAATDNILALDYFADLLPELAAADIDLQLFYEVKANLTRERVRALRSAGIKEIQPGIESLSTRLLRLMRKGVTAIQNIQLLKWCYEYELEPAWNILFDFPGEHADDYKDLPQTMRLLFHLRPPVGICPISYQRFSPYFFDRDKYGIVLTPDKAYDFIFPRSKVNIERIAYYFDSVDRQSGRDSTTDYIEPARAVWKQWRSHFLAGNVVCYYSKGPTYLVISDNRPRTDGASISCRQTVLGEKLAFVYLLCDEARTVGTVYDSVRDRFGRETTSSTVEGWLNALTFQGLMYREDDRYLSLAVRRKPTIRLLQKSSASN
jgi:ribosomal peptide maturation radical SAM protein 1